MATDHRTTLAGIKRFDQLVRYLKDPMGWPIEGGDFEEMTFEYTPEELGIDAANAAKIQEIKRLRPLSASQPWGIFFVKFEPKRLPVVALRRILSQVALKKRASANNAERAAWAADDLLFISNYGEGDERQISFAHFSQPRERNDLPTLKVLGWDNLDTALHLDAVAKGLTEHLSWPDDQTDAKAWRQRWRGAFTLRHREVITTSMDLSIRLAELARDICDRIKSALAIESARGPLTKLMTAFRESLVHDLDADGFADMYAQTIAYGLLSARIADPTRKTADDFAAHMRTSPFLRELMETFLHVGGRRGKAGGPGIDFDELGVSEVTALLDQANMEAVVRDFGDRNRQEDPVIHFYELFLTAYDKQKKIRRGVFYTPQPVVSYIVRNVHELLQAEFGLADGLADTTTWGEMLKKHSGLKLPPLTDAPGEQRTISPHEPFVQILDPATGTATFLVEVIDVVHRTLAAKWARQRLTDAQQLDAWNDYVPKHLLPRLHAFELMMAPYAIAHMKIGLKLAETGYRFGSEERARIYLTNALEPWVRQLPLIGFDALAHEAAAVNEVKRNKRFTVVVGNPPYSDASQNMGEGTAQLIEPFRYFQESRIKEPGAIRFEHCINNDYVKFWGLTLSILNQTPLAVAALITSNTFLGGKSFRGVRDAMLSRVSRIEVLDLHGEGWAGDLAKQGIKDENVFDITTGVAITSLVKLATIKAKATVLHTEGTGSYHEKERQLAELKYATTAAKIILDPRQYFPFMPQVGVVNEEYWTWPQVDTLFKASVDGIKTSRDGLVIANTREGCRQKIMAFADSVANLGDIEKEFCVSGKGFDIRAAQRHLKKNFDDKLIVPIMYRPFDMRFIYYDKELILSHRMNVMPSMFHKRAWSLVFASRLSAKGFDHVIACADLCAHKFASHDINSRMFPVVGLFDSVLGKQQLMSNFPDALLESMPKGDQSSEVDVASEIGEYLYAVFNAPSYRSRYHESISQDFPRVPVDASLALFTRLSENGKALVKLHTMGEAPPDGVFPFSGAIGESLTSPRWKGNTLAISGSSEIAGVERDVWEFRMCGYDVCKSWFSAGRKARIQREGENLTKACVLQMRTMLWAIRETIRIRKEIDSAIEEFGGWPAAFSTQPAAVVQ